MASRITTAEFIIKANLKHNNKYNYSNTIYTGRHNYLLIICPIHGEFKQTAGNHLKYGCNKCAGLNQTNADIIHKFKLKHNNNYDYSKIEYLNYKTKLLIKCNKHNFEFTQTAYQHLHAHTPCMKCRVENRQLTTNKFILNAMSIHGNKYNYSNVKYINRHHKVNIICKIHGEFKQNPGDHLSGNGCPYCQGLHKTNSIIIQDFINKHGLKYNYSKVKYTNSKTKITIICKTHGEFTQTPNDHLSGYGCPICGHIKSKQELDIFNWIKSNINYNIESNKRFNENNKYKYELDIYIPELNLGIEYNGITFHHTHGSNYIGNNKFHKDKYYHRNKSKWFLDNYNIRIIHIWDYEWLNKQSIVKNILKMQLNINRYKIYARKCNIKLITNKEAKPILESSHIQGHINSTLVYGLYYNNKLVSVMGFSKSTQGSADWELTRFVNRKGFVVIGGAQKLFSGFLKDHITPIVKSFSLIRLFSGNLYKQLGFKQINILPPTYFYHKNKQIINRRSAQKKNIHKIIPDYIYNNNETEVSTMNNNNWFQVFDSGMIHWEYNMV